MRISCKVATLRQIRPSYLKILNIYSSAVISLVKIETLVLEEATMKLFFFLLDLLSIIATSNVANIFKKVSPLTSGFVKITLFRYFLCHVQSAWTLI